MIDDEDKTILGNPYPDLVWSLGNNFGFGAFDLGNDIIQDASYLALRNVRLGFDLGSVVNDQNFFNSAKVILSGQNLFYKWADDYTGLNPESNNQNSPTTWGYQRAGSPIQRTVTVGLNVEF